MAPVAACLAECILADLGECGHSVLSVAISLVIP